MQSPPISQSEIDARIHPHIDELLKLWWAEQGTSKPKDLELIASVIPFSRSKPIRVLDLCCGPGDVGRAIRQIYPNAHIDFIDRDPFLSAICRAVNQRERIPGKLVVKDLEDDGWLNELSGNYDVVATVNSLHWFDPIRAEQLMKDIRRMLRDGGLFVLAEPVSAKKSFASGFEEWKAKQPPRYTRENWERFWSRANGVLGYDHTALLSARDVKRIDDGMSVMGWARLLECAEFEHFDVLLRDADQVIVGGMKSAEAKK